MSAPKSGSSQASQGTSTTTVNGCGVECSMTRKCLHTIPWPRYFGGLQDASPN